MNDVKKLHLGCGERYLSGYIHVDINKLDHIDIVTSVDNLDMFEDDSIDEIYSSHVTFTYGSGAHETWLYGYIDIAII